MKNTITREQVQKYNQMVEAAIGTEAYNKLKDTMEVADLVKFAKYNASNLENDIAMNNMTDFVNESYAHYQDMKAKEELQQKNMKQAEAEGKEANHV